MRVSSFNVVVILDWYSHHLMPKLSKQQSLHGFRIHINPHVLSTHMLDRQIPLGHPIRDQKEPILDKYACYSYPPTFFRSSREEWSIYYLGTGDCSRSCTPVLPSSTCTIKSYLEHRRYLTVLILLSSSHSSCVFSQC